MSRSRSRFFTVLFSALMALSGVANAHFMQENESNFSYVDGVRIAPVPAFNAPCKSLHHCNTDRGMHRDFHHHPMMGPKAHHHGLFVCRKYTYEITPMHRDATCTEWKLVMPPHHMSHWHHWHHYSQH